MCDTLVSLANNNAEKGVTYFAKNSDREPDEPQLVEYYSSVPRERKIRVTRVEVEVKGRVEASRIVISRPTWMWGAEMGFNEHGVAMGNEAIFTRRRFPKQGMLGMDVLRIGLELGKSARDALDVMVDLVERYGVGGSNSLKKEEYYDNSFLISDRERAFVLETYGNRWRYEEVKGYASISNAPFEPLEGRGENFRYKLNLLYTYLGRGREREAYTSSALAKGSVTLRDVMTIMRHHKRERFCPRKGSNEDVCMHSGSLTRTSQTANSMIVELRQEYVIGWFTFSSNPCISLYKPLVVGEGHIKIPYDEDYWLKAQSIHDRLSRKDADLYAKAMEITEKRQEELLDIVGEARGRLPSGDVAERVYKRAAEIDREHLNELASL